MSDNHNHDHIHEHEHFHEHSHVDENGNTYVHTHSHSDGSHQHDHGHIHSAEHTRRVLNRMARIIGHKIRKNGRIAVIAIAIVAGLSAAAASMISNSRLYVFDFLPEGGVSMLLYILIALGIYAVLQIFIYRLCSKAMVR